MSAKKAKTLPSPTPKAEKKRSEILKAATRCFRKTGFHQTSMQEICAEIGLGPGAVYRYFSSKDAIIEAIAEDERRQARAILQDLREAAHLPDALAGVAQAFAGRYTASSDVGLMTEIYAEGLRNKRVGQVVRKAEAEWLDGLTELLGNAQARGQVDPALDARGTALLLTATWDGMVIRQAYSPEDKPQALLASFSTMLKRLLICDSKTEKPIEKRSRSSAPIAIPLPLPLPLPLPVVVQKDSTERTALLDPRQMSLI